jgi:hypothetical protein
MNHTEDKMASKRMNWKEDIDKMDDERMKHEHSGTK